MKTLLIATLLIALGNPSLKPAFQEKEEEVSSSREDLKSKKLWGKDIQAEEAKDIKDYRYDVPPEGQILKKEDEEE
jgi:hypothetical protein